MAGSGFSPLVEGPEPCPLCDGPCTHDLERGEYRLGDPMDKHPSRKREEAKPMPKKRPHGKRRPAEDRARHLSEDR